MLVSSNCFLDSGKYVVIGYLESRSSMKHEGFQVPLLEVPLSAPFQGTKVYVGPPVRFHGSALTTC